MYETEKIDLFTLFNYNSSLPCVYTVRKVTLLSYLAWICLILAKLTINGGHVQEPKLITSGTPLLATLRRRTVSSEDGTCTMGFGASSYNFAV